MKKAIATILLVFCTLITVAQESQTAYNFLRIPVSAHAAALGGENITLVEDDEALIYHNPALLSTVSDKTLCIDYNHYMAGINIAGAAFNRILKERTSVAFSARYVGYGKMKETDVNNIQTGEFSAKDIALSAYLSYLLTDKLAGGITTKFITSYIGDYHSVAVGVDLGLNYFDSAREWSVSLVAKNLGGQLKAYNEQYERMPIDVQLGVSKRITHTPFRLSATLVELTNWNYSLGQHLVVGCDILLSSTIWVGMGYNFRRKHDMKIKSGEDESSHWAGFSFGGGINLERLKLNLAYGKYHVSGSSLLVNFAYTL